MKMHYRHKNRILTTIVTGITFLLVLVLFFILNATMSTEITLLVTFGVGIFLLTIYHFYLYEHCHEHTTMINNLTQIYFGVILLVAIAMMLLLRLVFSVELIDSYIILSLIVLATVFLTLGPYDRFLEEHIGKRFPMNAPVKKPAKKRK